ncbi:citrate synthase [Psychromicrobium lacuslunae]|uniref:citrate synthase (unknown stereospecificity) n=1 Tax=Psychromicrobium lacuslunae TaxID=1618207 RepID=A0A0D4C0V7_9MICC|nr:citrate synthase [Psychromicrobium lacuslunae]AJT42184.1 hypothetical protein UM93_12965 [Psychromicrobium lacuslunae]
MTRLSTAQAAARLGVKPATLYAYVSRGLISSERAVDHSGSTFDPLEVEALARSRSRQTAERAQSGDTLSGTPLMVLDSPITLLQNDQLYLRGLPATELASRYSFEQVASWLWGAVSQPSDSSEPFRASAEVIAAVRQSQHALGPEARGIDHMQLALLLAASHDSLKRDLGDQSIAALGRRIIGLLVQALPGPAALSHNIAEQLWEKLADRPAEALDLELMNTALVLLVDHDLAASTLAARVAASARAHPYAALLSSLAAFDSHLHGSVSVDAAGMLRQVIDGSTPEQAISQQLSRGSRQGGSWIPGFGHRIYQHRDPRAGALLGLLQSGSHYQEAMRAAAAVISVVRARTEQLVNVDFAIAVLMIGAGMRSDAGQTIFAHARTVGWLAHIMDEYGQAALRLRPVGQYSGPLPNHPL